MKIKAIEAFEIDPEIKGKRRAGPYQSKGLQPASPMERYERYKGERSAWGPKWGMAACMVEAEDGTFGVGLTSFAGPVVPIINDHFAGQLVGEPCLATEKLFDMMMRISTPYGSQGLGSYAISAVDLALWDLKGKLLEKPVYELLGGPQKERIPCYATGFDVDWYLELGFRAIKLPMPYGPVDGAEGLARAEEMVAQARDRVGPEVELMLDCWMALDIEYTVRLAQTLKPYRLKWIEDFLLPDDLHGFAQVRRLLPEHGLATGEHWYMPNTFAQAAAAGWVNILQPDVLWCGGISAAVRICHIAEAFGVTVIPHGGMNYPYGQHLVHAMPATTLGERSGGVSRPGVPLEDMAMIPGTPAIKDGYLVPSAAPGFGLEVDRAWFEQAAVAAPRGRIQRSYQV